MKPTTEHAEHTDPATPLKEPGGHPVLTALAVLAVGAATAFFLHLRAPLRRLVSELVLNWGTGPRTPGDWALLVPTWAVVCIAAGIVGILLVAFLMRKGALALSLAALVAAPFFLAFAILSLHAATFLPLSDAFQSMAKAASATAPALLPEPLSAVRLGMTESELLAARPAAQRDEYQPWPGIVELEERFTDGPFQSAAYTLADVPDGAGTLDGVLLFSGEPTENTTTNAAFAAVLAEAKSRLGPAPRRFELIKWGVAFDVHAWETNDAVAACLTISRALDPDDRATAADGRFFFLAFRRETAEQIPPMHGDLCAILAAALDRPAAEDGRPVAWVAPLPATNRIDQYLAGGRVASRERGDAVLALVSDYGSFPFSVERDDFAIGETHAGFVEILFSGRGIDVDDPHAIFVSLDGSKLRVDDADYLLFSVPEDRRAAMRDAVAPLVRAEKTHAESAEPEPHAESAKNAE